MKITMWEKFNEYSLGSELISKYIKKEFEWMYPVSELKLLPETLVIKWKSQYKE